MLEHLSESRTIAYVSERTGVIAILVERVFDILASLNLVQRQGGTFTADKGLIPLVSLIRAEGIRPEDVRVTVGTIRCGNEETGHVWVELFTGGHWMALDPCSGPYWDDKVEKLVLRQGVPFDYYASHTYPALQIWAYYNDIYYLDPRTYSYNVPASWRSYVKAI